MSKHLTERAKQIVEQVLYITIATTSKEGQPWNSPVFSAYDPEYNFYWGSNIDSQHSKNINDTGNAFLVIYDSTVDAGQGEGVYVQAVCEELTDPEEIKMAHHLLQSRRPVPYWKLEEVMPPAPVRLYRATPKMVWMNDDGESGGQYIDVRKEAWD